MDCSLPGFFFPGLLRQEYENDLPFPSPEDFPDRGTQPGLLLGRWILFHWAMWETHIVHNFIYLKFLENGKHSVLMHTHTHTQQDKNCLEIRMEAVISYNSREEVRCNGYVLKLIFDDKCITIQYIFIKIINWYLLLTWMNFMVYKLYSIKASKKKEVFIKVLIK